MSAWLATRAMSCDRSRARRVGTTRARRHGGTRAQDWACGRCRAASGTKICVVRLSQSGGRARSSWRSSANEKWLAPPGWRCNKVLVRTQGRSLVSPRWDTRRMKFGVTPRRACVLNKAGWWRKSARSRRVERWDSKCRHVDGASGYRVGLTPKLVHTGTVGRWGGSIPPWTQVRPCSKLLGVVSTPPSRPRYAQKDFTWSWAQELRDAARG